MLDVKRLWPQPGRIQTSDSTQPVTRVLVCCDAPALEPSSALIGDLSRIAGLSFEILRNAERPSGDIESGSGVLELKIRADETGDETGSIEAYHLELGSEGCTLAVSTRKGASYGLVTLAQIVAMCRTGDDRTVDIPGLSIDDAPTYRKRCFMVDPGRSVFPVPLLRRIVRILAQLKMNQLHLHLYDDELCGIRFPGLPFGTENPYAIELDDLAALIAYAADYEVEIVPELEGWGHVGTLTYHRPELLGGPGMPGCSASSFRVGPSSIALMSELIGQIASILPDGGTIHLGLDEAEWFPADDAPAGFTPSDLVGRYWDAVSRAAERNGKSFDLRLWADHAGRPVPPGIEDHLIIEPWQYWNTMRSKIDRAIGRYGGKGKMRFMMGSGQSVAQYRGAYHATRYWAQQAADVPNVEGGNITFWGANDIDRNFVSLFVGSSYLWNPFPETEYAATEDYEAFDRQVLPIMEEWQTMVEDARPDAFLADRGPFVRLGRFVWGPDHMKPVAPTVTAHELAQHHDYMNEA